MDVRLARIDNVVTVVTTSGGQSVNHNAIGAGGSGSQQASPTPGGSGGGGAGNILMGGMNSTNNNVSGLSIASGDATIVSIKQESLASLDSIVGGGYVDSTTFLHSPGSQMVQGSLGVHGGEGGGSGESMNDEGGGQGDDCTNVFSTFADTRLFSELFSWFCILFSLCRCVSQCCICVFLISIKRDFFSIYSLFRFV